MRRREFIGVLGGLAAWPPIARAQPASVPVIGLLGSATATTWAPYVEAFLQGLSGAGIIDGQNAAIEYRWAEGKYDRLPAMAADLVQHRVSVIAALTTPSAVAAKAATTAIPIVFTTVGDPVQIGLVTSLRHPGGNITGATYLNVEVGPKLLELLREMVPTMTRVALLTNPTGPNSETVSKNLQAAAHALGLQLDVVNASTEQQIDTAFAILARQRADGLIIASDVLLVMRYEQVVELARHHAVPAIYQERSSVIAGGLMSYSGDARDAYHEAGAYTGRILKGERPADLPVQQTTKVELVINLKTAKALRLNVPLSLLGRADELVE